MPIRSSCVRGAVLLATLLLVPTANARAAESDNHQHAHVHGIAMLGIAIDRDVVTIQLESPLDSLIGFEHGARTVTERAAVEALHARMKAPAGLFAMDAAARCKLQKADAESAIFDPARAAEGEHADLDASFEYRCEHIERVSTIDVGLFAAYPRLQHIEVAVATPKGQFKHDLRRPAHAIPMSR